MSGQFQIESWTTDNGLPQNTVYSIVQTPDGYLWMTTLDGVVRFDGVRFTVFNKNNTEGIESNRFIKLVLDGNGNLWIGTETNFITRFYQGNFQTYRFDLNGQANRIHSLSTNRQQELSVSTDGGIFRWSGEEFIKYVPLDGKSVGSVVLWSRNGTFWYVEKQTLFRVKDDQISEYRLTVTNEAIRVTKLLEDRRGRIWLGTQNAGLFYFENEKISKFTFEEDSQQDISPSMEDADGNVWAASTDGMFIIAPDDKVNRLTTARGLSENLVTTAFQDREGNVWIGTQRRGINRLSRQKVAFYSAEDGLTADPIYPIFQDREGDIWIGGENLTKYKDGSFSAIAGREKIIKTVTAISQDRSGRLWFGNWSGAYYFENNQFKDFTGNLDWQGAVFAIHEDKNGAMWFATNSGLIRYQKDLMTRFTSGDGLAGNDVKVICESSDGALWIGTYGGLTRIEGNTFISFTKEDGLASNQIRSLYEDADGVLWIGSYDGGLTRFKDGKFTRYTTNDGLFNEGVFQILEDGQGWFWMSSNRGIYRVLKQQLNDFADGKINRIESIAYNKDDGLLETECNGGQQPAGIKAHDGKLWFPTQGGVAVINPEEIKPNPIPPPVVIETIKIDNEFSDNTQSAIEIAPGKNNLEIAYTGLSFVKPEFVRFRYKLEGQDADWIEAGNRRTAYYSYLPPGSYSFQVIAANSDGVWNTEGARIKIVVQPPFYRTWWFWILTVSALGGAAYMYYRRRINRLEKEKTAQQAFSQKLIESQEQDRKRIAAELHDGLGQSLVIIKNRAVLGTDKRDDSERAFEQLGEIAAAASEAINEVRDITYNLRPYQLDRLGLTKSIESMIRRANDEIEFETNIDRIDGAFPAETEINVYRIVQESINNIVKHSNATHAKIKIKRVTDAVEITIQDNGKGFDANNDGTGFGLIGIAERARIFGGDFSIRSALEQGTIVNVKLPSKSATGEEILQ